ncbi:MAG: hypothetical protein ACI8UD_003806 [Planctomycetota bacterium]
MTATLSNKNKTKAQKITKEWLAAAKRYDRVSQTGLDIARIKKIHKFQTQFNTGASDDLPGLDDLLPLQKWAVAARKWCRKSHSEFEKWCAKGPDFGMSSISSQLKLGSAKTTPYIEIRDDLKKPLRELELSIRNIRLSWHGMIELLDQLPKLVKGMIEVIEASDRAIAKKQKPKSSRPSGLGLDIIGYVRGIPWLSGL